MSECERSEQRKEQTRVSVALRLWVTERSRFVGVPLVKVPDQILGVGEVSGRFFCGIIGSILVAFPPNRVEESPVLVSPVDARVHNLGDFVLEVSIDLDRRGRSDVPVWKWVFKVRFEKGNVEDVMNGT